MNTFKHLVIVDHPEVMRNQTNKNFIIADEAKALDTTWVIISYVSGRVHPEFIERIQSRFKPQPFELRTKGYIHHEGRFHVSICNNTRTYIGRPGELLQDMDLRVEIIDEFLYSEETFIPDCCGIEVEIEPWMELDEVNS